MDPGLHRRLPLIKPSGTLHEHLLFSVHQIQYVCFTHHYSWRSERSHNVMDMFFRNANRTKSWKQNLNCFIYAWLKNMPFISRFMLKLCNSHWFFYMQYKCISNTILNIVLKIQAYIWTIFIKWNIFSLGINCCRSQTVSMNGVWFLTDLNKYGYSLC